jgi:hypothetical protein
VGQRQTLALSPALVMDATVSCCCSAVETRRMRTIRTIVGNTTSLRLMRLRRTVDVGLLDIQTWDCGRRS